MVDDPNRDNLPDESPDDRSSSEHNQAGNNPDNPTPGGQQPENPLEAMFKAFGLSGDPASGGVGMAELMAQMQNAFAGMGTMFGMPGAGGATSAAGVNWDQVKDIARKTVASLGPDPSPFDNQRAEIREATTLAEGWLDEATAFPRVSGAPVAWSRAEWIENTMPVWRRLAEPVAGSMADALAGALLKGGPEDAAQNPFAGMQDMFGPILRSSGGAMFSMQMGQGLGTLATQIVGVTDIGVPLVDQQRVVLLPANVAAFGDGLDQSDTDVRIYLTLREAARQRLFARHTWLRDQVLGLVLQYAKGITIDTSALEDAVGELEGSFDPSQLEELSGRLEGSLLEPAKTPEQRETLESVETLLALIEGWVDEVVGQATERWMPSAAALTETIRRNRVTGGPAEQTFANLIGLELRPKRIRDAATLWAALREARGPEGRDAVWAHPDLMPDATALDDPLGFVGGEESTTTGTDFDAELAKLLEQGSEGDSGPGSRGSGGPGSGGPGSGDGPDKG